jgi:hypothetical protein
MNRYLAVLRLGELFAPLTLRYPFSLRSCPHIHVRALGACTSAMCPLDDGGSDAAEARLRSAFRTSSVATDEACSNGYIAT